jgi:hypothetical protein
MSRRFVEIPVEVWEFSLEDAEHIAALHKECLRLMAESDRLKSLARDIYERSQLPALPKADYKLLYGINPQQEAKSNG